MTHKRSDETIFHERAKQSWPKGKPFKILSIDGGGIKGILPAAILREIEAEFCMGKPIGEYFDMFSGTSTGGILAIGLASRKSARELFDLYTDAKSGGAIFKKSKNPIIYGWSGTLHDRKPLEDMIHKTLGERSFGEARTRMVIPAVNQYGEPSMYKTDHHPDYKRDHTELMSRIALDTSAAPIYLGGNTTGEEVCVDGGLFMNNPIMGAVVDALACYDLARQDIRVLSIGCGKYGKDITIKKANGGNWQWRDTLDYMSQLQSHNAIGQAGLLIGRRNILRLNPDLSSPINMDDFAAAKDRLPALGKTTFRRHKEDIRPFFEDVVEAREAHYA